MISSHRICNSTFAGGHLAGRCTVPGPLFQNSTGGVGEAMAALDGLSAMPAGRFDAGPVDTLPARPSLRAAPWRGWSLWFAPPLSFTQERDMTLDSMIIYAAAANIALILFIVWRDLAS